MSSVGYYEELERFDRPFIAFWDYTRHVLVKESVKAPMKLMILKGSCILTFDDQKIRGDV